jgi:hypothetical protein
MKNLVITLVLVWLAALRTHPAASQAKDTLVKEVKVDWDTKTFQTDLPFDQEFMLKIYAKQVAGKQVIPDSIALVRFLDRRIFYFYQQPITFLKRESGVSTASLIKATSKETKKAGSTETEITKEYNGDIDDKSFDIVTYKVSPLRANFKYCVMDKKDFYRGTYEEKEAEDYKRELRTAGTPAASASLDYYQNSVAGLTEDGKIAKQINKGSVAHTYLSVNNNNARRVTAIIGVAYLATNKSTIRPALGLRYNLYPVSKTVQSKLYNDMHFSGKRQKILSRLSIDVALTLASIKDSTANRFDLFGRSSLLTGVGYRLGDSFFLSGGRVCFSKDGREERPLEIRTTSKWYASLSFDWDISKSFDSFKKALGAGM